MPEHSGDLIAFALLPILILAACRGPSPRPDGAPSAKGVDNAEVARLCAEDQADRTPAEGQPIDWKLVGPRDAERLARVKELYRAGALKSGPDFQRAALVLQHGSEPDDYALAHELCIVAIAKGELDALWLCAASEDRFLMKIGRPQRFATQYGSDAGGPLHLYAVGAGVTDELRALFHAPSLEEAKQREALINSLSGQKH